MTTYQLTASGNAIAVSTKASIINARVMKLTAAGFARASGTAQVTTKLPAGGLTDFGIWNGNQPDTAMSRDMAHSIGSDSTAAATWLTASAPTKYSRGGAALWNEAVYAGVGIKWTNLATNEKHAFGNVQLENVPTGNRLSWDATSWEGRRCYISQANAGYSSVGVSTDKAFSGSKSGKITYLGAPAGQWGYWINPTTPTGMAACTPGEILNGSVSLSIGRQAWWSAGIQFYDSSYAQIGGTTWYTTTYQKHPGGGAWDTSYVYNVTAPAGAVWVAIVPHISINSTPAATDHIAPIGEIAYTDMHRIWARPYSLVGTPTTYKPPRKLSIKVKANRVNLINNPAFDTEIWGWGALGYGTAPFPCTWDSGVGRSKNGSLKFTIPNNPSSFGLSGPSGTGLLTAWSSSEIGGFGWKVSTTYTNSVYIRLGTGCPPVTISPGSYTPIAGVLSTDDALTNHPELIEGDWIRLWATFTTGDSDDGLVGLLATVDSAKIPAAGATFWIDDAMSEVGDQLLPYFSGGSPGADYLWAGTPGRSSSHYYREFRSSAYRLSDIVRSVVPHGTQYDLLYAQPPQ